MLIVVVGVVVHLSGVLTKAINGPACVIAGVCCFGAVEIPCSAVVGVSRDEGGGFLSRDQVASVMARRIAQDWDSFVEGSEDETAVEGRDGDGGGKLHP